MKELRVLLAITIIALFSISVFHALSLAETDSTASAYRSILLTVFAFVWAMMVWLAYEDSLRFREVIMVTVMGLALIAILEVSLVLTGSIDHAMVSTPWGETLPFEEAVWTEVAIISTWALLIFYFRPRRPGLEIGMQMQ